MVRSGPACLVGGGLGPAPLAAVAGASPAVHPASGTPLYSALGWVFRSATVLMPAPLWADLRGVSSAPSRRGLWSATARPSWWGGFGAPPPWRPLLAPAPRSAPCIGHPPSVARRARFSGLPSVLTPCPLLGQPTGGFLCPFPQGLVVCSSAARLVGGGGWAPPIRRPLLCPPPPRGAPCIGHPPL